MTIGIPDLKEVGIDPIDNMVLGLNRDMSLLEGNSKKRRSRETQDEDFKKAVVFTIIIVVMLLVVQVVRWMVGRL